MATNFPTSLDTLTNPTSTDQVATVDHAAQHANINDAVEALQAKVGIDSSAVTTSHDYKLSGVTGSNIAASRAGAETLTNKTIGDTNTINAQDDAFTIDDAADATLQIDFNVAGTTATKTTITSSQTANRVITLPNATDTLVGKATTDTFTNKTFDANGTGNSLSNVDVADLANGTDGELITWDAAGAPATVATGSNGQVLTSNGAGAAPTFQNISGVTKNYRISTVSAFDMDDDSETTVDSFTVPANELGTEGAIVGRLYIHSISDTGNCGTLTIKMKYGSTTVCTLTISNPIDGQLGYIDFQLQNTGSTSAQRGHITYFTSENSTGTAVSQASATVTGTATEDSTGALTFAVTNQRSLTGTCTHTVSGIFQLTDQ